MVRKTVEDTGLHKRRIMEEKWDKALQSAKIAMTIEKPNEEIVNKRVIGFQDIMGCQNGDFYRNEKEMCTQCDDFGSPHIYIYILWKISVHLLDRITGGTNSLHG